MAGPLVVTVVPPVVPLWGPARVLLPFSPTGGYRRAAGPSRSPRSLILPKRLQELDVLRGVAALAVVACHFTSTCVQLGCMSEDFHYGTYGPHLFFVISGFVILLTLRRTETATDFVVSRCSRLYPVYWVAVGVSFAAFTYFPPPGESVDFSQALVNLTMLQTWLGVPDLDVVYWTLAVELKFYALMLGLFLAGWLGAVDLIAGLWLLTILSYWGATTLLAVPVPAAVATPLNVDYGHLFIAGILFYRLKTEGNRAYRHLLLACCLATQMVTGGLESAVIVAGFFALFYLFVWDRLRWIVCRPLVVLGSISYALYLLHHPVGNVVILSLHGLTRSPLLLTVPAFGASIGAAAAVTYLIEQPALKGLRRLYKRARQPAHAPCRAVPAPLPQASLGPRGCPRCPTRTHAPGRSRSQHFPAEPVEFGSGSGDLFSELPYEASLPVVDFAVGIQGLQQIELLAEDDLSVSQDVLFQR